MSLANTTKSNSDLFKGVLKNILDLKNILPNNITSAETSGFKLNKGVGMRYGDYKMILDKIHVDGFADVKNLGNDGLGVWGDDKILLANINWQKIAETINTLNTEKINFTPHKKEIAEKTSVKFLEGAKNNKFINTTINVGNSNQMHNNPGYDYTNTTSKTRWYNNPYLITIVGGVIVALIVYFLKLNN